MANKQFFLDRETDPLNPALEVANKDELIKVYTDAGDLITDLGNLDDNEIAACEGNDFQNVYISNTITAGDLNVPTADAVKTYVDSNIPATKIFGPFTLGSADFTSDNTYSDYPYKITITCVGVDDSYSASVNFSTADAHLGIFSPFAETGSDAVSFYASSIPTANVTVTSIVCTAIPDGVNEGGSTNAYKGTKYSTSETFTGNYWIDGKPIYRKVFSTGSWAGIVGLTYKRIDISSTNFDQVVDYSVTMIHPGAFQWRLPIVYVTTAGTIQAGIGAYIDIGNKELCACSTTNYPQYTDGYAIIEYTKN